MKDQLFSLMTEFNEKQDLLSRLTKDARLQEYTPMELYILSAIGKSDSPNVTSLSKALHLSKGTVSKTVRALMERGFVSSYMTGENRQKIFYTLTEAGEALYELHEQRDRSWQALNRRFLDRLSEDELRNAKSYLSAYVAFLGEAIESWEAGEDAGQKGR